MELITHDPDHILLDGKQTTFAVALENVSAEDLRAALAAAWQRQRQAFNEEAQTLKAARTAALTEIATFKASADVTAARTAQALTAATALLAKSDLEKIKAGVRQIIAFAEAPETARKIAEAEAERAKLDARLVALKAAQ